MSTEAGEVHHRGQGEAGRLPSPAGLDAPLGPRATGGQPRLGGRLGRTCAAKGRARRADTAVVQRLQPFEGVENARSREGRAHRLRAAALRPDRARCLGKPQRPVALTGNSPRDKAAARPSQHVESAPIMTSTRKPPVTQKYILPALTGVLAVALVAVAAYAFTSITSLNTDVESAKAQLAEAKSDTGERFDDVNSNVQSIQTNVNDLQSTAKENEKTAHLAQNARKRVEKSVRKKSLIDLQKYYRSPPGRSTASRPPPTHWTAWARVSSTARSSSRPTRPPSIRTARSSGRRFTANSPSNFPVVERRIVRRARGPLRRAFLFKGPGRSRWAFAPGWPPTCRACHRPTWARAPDGAYNACAQASRPRYRSEHGLRDLTKVDTALVYSAGESEEIACKALKGRRGVSRR